MSRTHMSTYQGRAGLAALAALIVLTLAAFTLDYSLQRRFLKLGVLDQYNVIFDMDPPCRLSGVANGWCSGNRNFAHPNLANMFNPPVRAVSWVVAKILSRTDDVTIRRQLALVIFASLSAVQTALVFLIMQALGFTRGQSFMISALYVASFSQLIFGSVPEHFTFSSLAIAVGFLMMINMLRVRGGDTRVGWVALGVVATGITITNIFPLSILRFGSLFGIGHTFRSAALRTVTTGMAAVSITFASAWALNHVYSGTEPAQDAKTFTQMYLAENPLGRFKSFPTAMVNTLLSTRPDLRDNIPAIEHNHKYGFQFTFRNQSGIFSSNRVAGTFLFVACVVGTILLIIRPGPTRMLGVAALGIVVYNWLFHSIWGAEQFLYAPHWLVALLILISGIFQVPQRLLPVSWLVFVTIVGGVALTNYTNIQYMLSILEDVPD